MKERRKWGWMQKKSAGEKWTNPRKSALKKIKASRCFYATCMWFFLALHTLRAVNSELQLPQRSWNVYGFVLKCLCTHTHTHTHTLHLPPKCHPLPSPPLHTLSTKLGSAGITELCWRPFFNSLTHQSFRSSAVHKDSFLSKGGRGGKKSFQYGGGLLWVATKSAKSLWSPPPQSERFSSVGQCPIRGCVKLVSRVVVEMK